MLITRNWVANYSSIFATENYIYAFWDYYTQRWNFSMHIFRFGLLAKSLQPCMTVTDDDDDDDADHV